MKPPVLPRWVQRYGRNFYLMSTLALLVWLTVFDSNDFISQYHNWRRLKDAYAEKAYYEEKTIEVTEDRTELMANPKLVEKFAREKYLMKKPNEDVYLVVEE
jgi:cell division protein FtsB